MPESNGRVANGFLSQIRAWHVVAVFVITLGSLVWGLSATHSAVIQNTRDIESLDVEARLAETRITRSEIDSAQRYARIETSLQNIEKKVDELNDDVKELRKP